MNPNTPCFARSSACSPPLHAQENNNQLITGKPAEALEMPLYKGMRLHITRNINKEADFINGMEATIEAYDAGSRCIHVVTKTGRHLAIYPITDYLEDCGTRFCFSKQACCMFNSVKSRTAVA